MKQFFYYRLKDGVIVRLKHGQYEMVRSYQRIMEDDQLDEFGQLTLDFRILEGELDEPVWWSDNITLDKFVYDLEAEELPKSEEIEMINNHLLEML